MQALVVIEAPGKVRAWREAGRVMGAEFTVVATGGHMSRFPDRLSPLGVRFLNGRADDIGRTVCARAAARLASALESVPSGAPILIATDDDIEGNVIALDALQALMTHDRSVASRARRIRARSVTPAAIEMAITSGSRSESAGDIIRDAAPGRARAITDRWIGLTYSRLSGTGCGRVRAAVLGATVLWNRAPDMLRGIPETGEITLQARSGSGGPAFTARIPLHGPAPRALARVAERYRGRLIPGYVSEMVSIGAAVAPRIGDVPPFNTGDAIAYASRFHGVGPKAAMRGLQNAYMAGRISYPRTDSRHLSKQSANLVVEAAHACGIRDASPGLAARHAPTGGEGPHEALHPTPSLRLDDLKRLRQTVRTGASRVSPGDDREVEDLMVGMVARRSFEASRSNELTRGIYHPRDGSDLAPEEIEALEDLEWTRPAGPGLPWPNRLTTGARSWPLPAVLVDLMMSEGIGRPSTLAAHAEAISSGNELRIPGPGSPPRPTEAGSRALKKLPREAWLPGTCRAIEKGLSSEQLPDGNTADLGRLVRSLIDGWVGAAPETIRDPLVAELNRAEADILARSASGLETDDPEPAPAPVTERSLSEIEDPTEEEALSDPAGVPETLLTDLTC